MIQNQPHRGGNPTVLLTVLIVVSFILMTFDIRSDGEGMAATLREGAQSLAAPLQDASRQISDPLVSMVDGLANLSTLREENARLRAENESFRLGAAEIEDLRSQNELLREILRIPKGEILEVVAVVRSGTGPLDAGFTIDVGLNQGVIAGNPVVNENDVLIGIVKEAFADSSSVVPVISPVQGVEVVSEDGQIGVVSGLGNAERVELVVIEADTDLLPGSILRTSGQQAGIPRGLPVAQVTELIRPEGGLIQSTAVEPLVNPVGLDIVRVLQYQVEPVDPDTVEPGGPGTEGSTTTTSVAG